MKLQKIINYKKFKKYMMKSTKSNFYRMKLQILQLIKLVKLNKLLTSSKVHFSNQKLIVNENKNINRLNIRIE